MPPIISIVGKSDSGKTTFLEKLVAEIRSRGYRVGSIKHDTHGFDIDHEGKDSWRHKQAGAAGVIISSPQKIAVVKDTDEDMAIDSLVSQYLSDMDIVFTEGYKREDKPKVEVSRKEMHRELLCQDDDKLVALVSNQVFAVAAPCFDINDAKGVADLLQEKYLKTSTEPSVSLVIDGTFVPLDQSVQETFINALKDMVSLMKKETGVHTIHLTVSVPSDREVPNGSEK